jgi:hypothetical protein
MHVCVNVSFIPTHTTLHYTTLHYATLQTIVMKNTRFKPTPAPADADPNAPFNLQNNEVCDMEHISM